MALSRTLSGPEAELDALAHAAARGDLAAFEQLHRATVARVHGLARRILGAGEAEEATQEVFLRAWRGLGSWRGEGAVRGWLVRLARNTIVNLARRRQPLGAPAGEELSELAGTEVQLGARLDLEQAIDRLPRGARAVFVLHDVEGASHEEIAAALDVSVGTSKSQLHRARLLLRAALAEGAPR